MTLVTGAEVNLVDLTLYLFSHMTCYQGYLFLWWSVNWYFPIYSTVESVRSGIRNVGVPISLSRVRCSMLWAGLAACCYLP